jgi:drug/metabolite transporter (DMT)-like permease
MNISTQFNCRLLINVGNTLTIIGCLVMFVGLIGLIPLDMFAVGLSSGIRVIATLAIMGCLLSAIGYGLMDYFDY